MSRSGYDEDCDQWQLIKWRGAVTSALRGKRGQSFLREMLAALDALPIKRLISHHLVENGEVCAIGAVGLSRGIDMSSFDPQDSDAVASSFGIAPAMARELVYLNDEALPYWSNETPEQRYGRMYRWLEAWTS